MISYDKICESDYDILTHIMKAAFDDDTRMHTDLKADGPWGYDDGTLIRKLNTKEGFISEKICVDGRTAGAYTICSDGKDYTLEMLFIDPDLKNCGIGCSVWEHIKSSNPDAERWFVETPDYSKRNHHFYMDKCGFKPYAEKAYEDGAKSIIFVLEGKK